MLQFFQALLSTNTAGLGYKQLLLVCIPTLLRLQSFAYSGANFHSPRTLVLWSFSLYFCLRHVIVYISMLVSLSFSVHSLPSHLPLSFSPSCHCLHLNVGLAIVQCPLTSFPSSSVFLSVMSLFTSQCWSRYRSVSTHFLPIFLCLSLHHVIVYISMLVSLSFSVHSLPSHLPLSFSPSCHCLHLNVGLAIVQCPLTSFPSSSVFLSVMSLFTSRCWSRYRSVSTHLLPIFLCLSLRHVIVYISMLVSLSFSVHSLPSSVFLSICSSHLGLVSLIV